MSHVVGASHPRAVRSRAVAIAAAGLAVVGAAALYWWYSHPRTLVEELAAQRLPRTALARISAETEYRPCAPPAGDRMLPSAQCAVPAEIAPNERILALGRRISAAADAGDPDGIHADVLVELALADSAYTRLPSLIDRLRWLADGPDSSADALADLSAALLIRAGRSQAPEDLIAAEQAAEEAVEIDPRNTTALFNRALALEMMTADSTAADAWNDYLAVERDPRWAAEARAHLRTTRWTPRKKPVAPTSDSALVALAADFPREARNFGWDRLAEWGSAVLRMQTTEADPALHRAEVIGRALEARKHDASLADAVRAIREHARNPAETARLATAHDLFGKGRAALGRVDRSAADSLLALAYALRASSPCLNAWIAVGLASARQTPDSERLVESALALDSTRYPALAGSALLTLGGIQIKAMKEDAARETNRAAIPLLERSGEAEPLADALVGAADAGWMRKDESEAFRDAYRAAYALREHRDSHTLHNLLALMATWAAQDGYAKAALRLHDEDLAVAQHTGVDVILVEAHDLRAEALARNGDIEAAKDEVDSAEPLLPRLDPRAREFFTTMFAATRGVISVRDDPRAAEAYLSAAMPRLRSAGVPLRRITALLARADARVALGETDSAKADSQEALALLDTARTTGLARISRDLSHRVRSTLDAVVMQLVAAGRAEDALRLFERGTSALGTGTVSDQPYRMPAGQVGIRYAVTGDTVLAWTVTSGGAHAIAIPVPTRDLEQRVTRVRQALAQREDEAALAELRALYGWLIRPIQRDLGAAETSLVIVPDGVLAGVPFSALHDEAGRRYLIEEHPLRRAASLADAAVARPPPRAAGTGVAVVVEDPAFDRQRYPQLRPLHAARGEVASVFAGALPRIVLAGADARADTLARELPGASLLHFAGHAIADEDEPDSSFLVLAPERGQPESGRLTAAAISEMHLDRLDLVVLSACSTLNDARGGGGGFTGLGGAFLTAGARGVIGSLWAVDDDRTGNLMRRFYAEYARDRDAAAALRQAQLEMLRTGGPGDRSPSAWAGFEYASR